MTREDKELLLKDLGARLLYNPLISINNERYRMEEIGNALIGIDTYKITINGRDIEDWNIKPYLLPLSSMTEEQKKEFDQLIELELKAINDEINPVQATEFEVDFYNKHHLDWRGLIPKGLAIEVTEENNPYKCNKV